MKNVRQRWLGLLILFLCFHGFAQSGPPSLPPTPLAEWPLALTNWDSTRDFPPRAFTNLNTVGSWEYDALSVDTNLPAFLNLDIYEPDGDVNVTFDSGTISFWCQVNWGSTANGGTGPGAWAPLWEAGDYTTNNLYGCWSLAISPDGNTLAFVTQTNGAGEVHFQTAIGWNAGDWHNVVLAYSPTNCALYLEGNLVTNTPPISYWPDYDECVSNGFWVGSDPTGTLQARAQFQELETYDSPLTADYIQQFYNDFAGDILAWGGSLPATGAAGGGFTDTFPGGPGGGTITGTGPSYTPYPDFTITTNYSQYTNFWLTVAFTNSATQTVVAINSTLSNLTYVILTNSVADTNLADWGVWETVVASNSVTITPPITIGSNNLFFASELVLITGTNSLPDWWQMEYFGELNVNPYADPDGDGLCNYSEYILGTNPTNAYSITTNHNDAQALFLAYTNDTTTRLWLFETNGPGTNAVTLTLSNTLVGSNYQIFSKDLSITNGCWRVEQNFLSTNSATETTVILNGRTLAFMAGYGEDSDGDGLPDGYEVLATHTDPLLADTGNTGTPDGYKDPDGDSYSNLQEYQNGTDPLVFDAPDAPSGLEVALQDISGSESASVTWTPSGGSVTGYIIERNTGSGFVAVATNSAGTTSYTDHSLPSGYNASYEIVAVYTNILTSPSSPINTLSNAFYSFPMAIVNGASNRLYLVVSAMPATITNFVLTRTVYSTNDEEDAYYPIDYNLWGEPCYGMPALTTNGTFSIPISAFTNGVARISDSEAPPFGTYDFYVQAVGVDGKSGPVVHCWGPSVSPMFHTFGNIPFLDGAAQMKQNLAFLARAYIDGLLGYDLFTYSGFGGNPEAEEGYPEILNYPSNYVYASYYTAAGALNPFRPFEDNSGYTNFVFSPAWSGAGGSPPDMSAGDYAPLQLYAGTNHPVAPFSTFQTYSYTTYSPVFGTFPTYSYVINSNQAAVAASLVNSNSQWIFTDDDYGFDDGGIENWGALYGIYQSVSQYTMTSDAVNGFGLPYESFEWEGSSGACQLLSPSLPVATSSVGYNFYAATQVPTFSTVGYYFTPLPAFQLDENYQNLGAGYDYDYWSDTFQYDPVTNSYPMPGDTSQAWFNATTTTPLIIASVGQVINIAGYAKQVATNGNTNMYAYLGQYFTNALQMENGSLTTNSAGIVSEYGSFFPMLPGEVALMTKPDSSQTNLQGQCIINVIRLSLDVNHDGVMDETFTGADYTSQQLPYTLWANNNFDRWTNDYIDNIQVEEDVSQAVNPGTQWVEPDCSYTNSSGQRAIPCPRDLEDYARLWVSGISSNVLAALPSGSTVTLSWAGVGSSPTIDLFQAIETNGGIAYLTNITTASNQLAPSLYVGRLGPGQSIQLNASTFSNSWAGNYYIFCGVATGNDQLNLTIADGSDNVLAQSSQFIQIKDIKDLYERWTVGETPGIAPSNNAVLAVNNLPQGDTEPFHYSHDAQTDTNIPYIVYVHGWNMPVWERDRWAETAYKRLYWQGYQGRFGLFRWPCYSVDYTVFGLPNFEHAKNFDLSEWAGWQTGQPLESYLAGLNGYYPTNVYLMAHSQGNVAAGEALRLAGTNQIVSTYVASQAAISARAYDNTVPTNVTIYYSLIAPDCEGYYFTNGASSYFSSSAGAGKYVNFYNPNDWALMGSSLLSGKPGWLWDQSSKPDTQEGYSYETPTIYFPSGYYQQSLGLTPTHSNWPQISKTFPTDTYEIFGMCAQSYSLALGAQTNVSASFDVTLQINLSGAPYNFGNQHVYHEFQFLSDNQTTDSYWLKMLQSFGLHN